MLNKLWLKTGRKYEDWREFWEALGNWACNKDFTYNDSALHSQNKMLLNFLADDYYGETGGMALDQFHLWDEQEKRKFARMAKRLNLTLTKKIAKYL